MHLPHTIPDEARLQEICARLNQRELDALDQPPHFGAWCPGRIGSDPAYVSFLPNALHRVAEIAGNVSFWAMHRARWAHDVLAREGFVP